jgi:hypothetical protein
MVALHTSQNPVMVSLWDFACETRNFGLIFQKEFQI